MLAWLLAKPNACAWQGQRRQKHQGREDLLECMFLLTLQGGRLWFGGGLYHAVQKVPQVSV